MRLLSKISYYYFSLSVVVLGITGFLLFLFLRHEISMEIEEQLELQTDMVAEEIRLGRPVNFPMVNIRADDERIMKLPKVFKDTLIYDRLQGESEGYYLFDESKKINGKPYRIRVMTTYIGWGNYSRAISYIFISIAVMLIVLGTLVNYLISRNIWNPFLINLKRMKGYSVSSKDELELIRSNVKEFQEMNKVLSDLAERGRKEYRALKEFTENASHEIQTPLSIVKTRLESISQLPIEPELGRLLNDAKQAVNRLSKVNKGLLLLAKLENDTFPDEQLVDLGSVLIRNIELMEDLFEHNSIPVVPDIGSKKIFASLSLMDVLISNLLSNALMHSSSGSGVSIVLNEWHLTISNQGQPLPFSSDKLFTRFGKGSPGLHGNGLGLSIAKQICILYGWEISYRYQNRAHYFEIKFPSEA